jgi:predicted Fe-Mo cluster-binding NifX family protein
MGASRSAQPREAIAIRKNRVEANPTQERDSMSLQMSTKNNASTVLIGQLGQKAVPENGYGTIRDCF